MKQIIDEAIATIKSIAVREPCKGIIYSAANANGDLGTSIFHVGNDVKEYIVSGLKRTGHVGSATPPLAWPPIHSPPSIVLGQHHGQDAVGHRWVRRMHHEITVVIVDDGDPAEVMLAVGVEAPQRRRPTLGGGLAQNPPLSKGRNLPSWRVAVVSVSATLARGAGACPRGPRAGVYRRREADRVSKACWGRPSSWRASRPCGLMQGPRLGAGRWLQTRRRPSNDLTAKNKQSRYHENHY